MTRTPQEILAERRSVVLERMGERDQLARAMLQYEINRLDEELKAVSK